MDTFSSSYSLIILFISISTFTLTSSTNSTTDQDALLSFKNGIKFSNPNSTFITNWSPNTPLCNWTGVSCSATHHRVTALNLSNLALRGNLDPHLGNLTFLQSLDVSSNNFMGELPSELSKLRRLKALNILGENPTYLSGSLPEDICGGDAAELRRVDFSENRLSGEIPARMYKCDTGMSTTDANVTPSDREAARETREQEEEEQSKEFETAEREELTPAVAEKNTRPRRQTRRPKKFGDFTSS